MFDLFLWLLNCAISLLRFLRSVPLSYLVIVFCVSFPLLALCFMIRCSKMSCFIKNMSCEMNVSAGDAAREMKNGNGKIKERE